MALAEAGNAVIIESGSGIGKSETLLAMFGEIKERDAKQGIRWGLGTIFAATQTPPDIIGFQFKGDRQFPDGTTDGEGKPNMRHVTVTDPSVPLWMISKRHGDDPGGKPAFMYDRFFLIIEEYGQGEADVKRSIAEIFLNGGSPPWYLPGCSTRSAATDTGARYRVPQDFAFCIARPPTLPVSGGTQATL